MKTLNGARNGRGYIDLGLIAFIIQTLKRLEAREMKFNGGSILFDVVLP